MRLIQAIWSRDDAFVTETGSLRFKSRAGQIGHTVAVGSSPLQHCVLQRVVLPGQTRKWVPKTRYTLRRNTASKIKDLI